MRIITIRKRSVNGTPVKKLASGTAYGQRVGNDAVTLTVQDVAGRTMVVELDANDLSLIAALLT